MFCTHNGPTDIITMTALLQLSFQCDADLAGNPTHLANRGLMKSRASVMT